MNSIFGVMSVCVIGNAFYKLQVFTEFILRTHIYAIFLRKSHRFNIPS